MVVAFFSYTQQNTQPIICTVEAQANANASSTSTFTSFKDFIFQGDLFAGDDLAQPVPLRTAQVNFELASDDHGVPISA